MRLYYLCCLTCSPFFLDFDCFSSTLDLDMVTSGTKARRRGKQFLRLPYRVGYVPAPRDGDRSEYVRLINVIQV